MSKHGSPTDTIRAIMSGQLNEHAPLHIDPPYDVEAALKVLHDAGCPSATRVDDKTISVNAADAQMSARVLTNALNKGAIPAPIKLISAESVADDIDDLHSTTNPTNEEAQLKPDETFVNDEYEVIRSLINKKENQLKKIDEVSRGTLASYVKKATDKVSDHSHHIGFHDGANNPMHDKSIHAERKLQNKKTGISRAVDRLTKESAVSYVTRKIEQINELSKNSLRNYIVKASAQAGKHNYASGVHAGANYQEKDAGERSRNTANQKAHGQKADKRFNGIARAAKKLAEETIEEKFDAKADHAAGYTHHIVDRHTGNVVGRAKSLSSALKSVDKRDNAYGAVRYSHKRLGESVDLTEGKKDNLDKSSKSFASHPRADKMFQDMQHAAKTCNYITDACDHVYNNHRDHIKYSEWHDMKPHIEDHFKQRGLE